MVYTGEGPRAEHERVVQAELARRLADLQGLTYLGDYDPAEHTGGRFYVLASWTVVGQQRARDLGIETEADLFGGVVPAPVVATKSITHPLVGPEATAAAGWSPEFPRRVAEAALPGYTAFSCADARAAGLRLLKRGPLRVKLALANAGRGQWVAADAEALARVLDELDPETVARGGVVLEEHLDDPVTYSVGQVRVGELVASYYGTQRLTEDNNGESVYGGSELVVTRGGFEALAALDLPDEVTTAVAQAQRYDAAADACFAGFFASRRNYDVACGREASGQRRCGVLEQSWRPGGASSAEILALERLAAPEGPRTVRAASLELYGTAQTPRPGALTLYRGDDPDAGPLGKYVSVERYDGHQ